MLLAKDITPVHVIGDVTELHALKSLRCVLLQLGSEGTKRSATTLRKRSEAFMRNVYVFIDRAEVSANAIDKASNSLYI